MAVSGSPESCIRPNSGGGHHHGGNGVIRRLRFLEPMTAAFSQGVVLLPLWVAEWKQQPGRNWVERRWNDGGTGQHSYCRDA